MPGIKLQKRDKDFFVSYGHADAVKATPVVDLLKRGCGMSIWFDGQDGNAAVRSSELLAEAIRNSRGAIFLLSEAWKKSSWCKDEFDVALSERRAQTGFEVIVARLDDAEPPAWFTITEILDLRELNLRAVVRLLCSLTADVPRRFDNMTDVYLAAPWSRPSALASQVFERLGNTGWRLVGDTPDHKYLGKDRIRSIQGTTRGVVAILPYDASQPDKTSPFILEETRIAVSINRPLLLLTEPGVLPPQDVTSAAFRGAAVPLDASAPANALVDLLDGFDEVIGHQELDDTGAYVFFAGSLLADSSEADDIDQVIERSSNMRCVRGQRLEGDNVQTAIVDRIRRAAVVIADVSDDHRNTLIEAGVAMGAGTRLKLMCRTPPEGTPLKARFMFQGQECFWYRTKEERLALCCYFARQFRRRVYVIR